MNKCKILLEIHFFSIILTLFLGTRVIEGAATGVWARASSATRSYLVVCNHMNANKSGHLSTVVITDLSIKGL